MKINAARFHKSLHLADNELLPPDSACVFCGFIKRFPVYLLQENPEVSLLKCHHCGAAIASRLPTSEALEMYYQKYYATQFFKGKNDCVTFIDTLKFGSHLAEKINKHLTGSSSLKILDFGGGTD
jgi:hypothetical protein